MRFFISLCLTLFLLGAAAVSALTYYVYDRFQQPLALTQEHVFVIPQGTSLIGIIQRLESQNVIDAGRYDGLIFRSVVRFKKLQNRLQAGEYMIQPRMSMADIVDLFISGKVLLKKITIPEGLTSFEIVQILNNHAEFEGNSIAVLPDEGSLMPETYHYNSTQNRQDIILWMQRDMRAAINDLWEKRAPDLPLSTKEEALILASIVEKETGIPSERKRVAGVFINRLNKGMLLQTDPTVIYAITEGKHESQGMGPLGRKIYKKDLKVDSPYNTYKYKGLPPGPIANPGYDAIEATLNPEIHDYLYFVATPEGGHKFAKSLKDHNRNVAAWRRSKN